jgi:hypothetical protein
MGSIIITPPSPYQRVVFVIYIEVSQPVMSANQSCQSVSQSVSIYYTHY